MQLHGAAGIAEGADVILWFLASSAFAGECNILRARGKSIPGRYIVHIAPGHEVRATVSELALGGPLGRASPPTRGPLGPDRPRPPCDRRRLDEWIKEFVERL